MSRFPKLVYVNLCFFLSFFFLFCAQLWYFHSCKFPEVAWQVPFLLLSSNNDKLRMWIKKKIWKTWKKNTPKIAFILNCSKSGLTLNVQRIIKQHLIKYYSAGFIWMLTLLWIGLYSTVNSTSREVLFISFYVNGHINGQC